MYGNEETQTTIHSMTNVGTTDKTLLGISANSQETRSKIVMSMKGHLKQLELSKWSYSRNPLSWAVNNGLTEVVHSLLREKAEVNKIDAVGRTALHECVTLVREGMSVGLLEESIKIAELLLEAGRTSTNPALVCARPSMSCSAAGKMRRQHPSHVWLEVKKAILSPVEALILY